MTQKVLSQEIAKIGKFVPFHVIIRQVMEHGINLGPHYFATGSK
jgi:hypothetical protein